MHHFKKFVVNISDRPLLVGVFIFFLALLPFVGNVHDPFVSDDWDMLYVNEHSGTPWHQYFSTNVLGEPSGGSYRPIVSLYWRLGYLFFHLNPIGLHLGNLFFHALNAVLIYSLVLLLLKNAPRKKMIGFLSALLFIVLPNHAEPVIWAAAPDVMMTSFYLLSVFLFLRSLSSFQKYRVVWRVASILLALLALFTKEMALTLPVIIFLSSALMREKERGRSKIKYLFLDALPYVLAVVFYFFVRYQALGILFGYYGPSSTFHLADGWRMFLDISLSHLVADQIQLIIRNAVFGHVGLVTFLLALMMGFIFWRGRERIHKDALAIGLMYMVSTVPVLSLFLGFIPFYFGSEGERYAYLPSVFAVMLLGWLISRLPRPRWMVGVMALLMIVFSFQLSVKTTRWHEASLLAEQSVQQVSRFLGEHPYDGALIIGLPDQVHGAVVFRNVFIRALSFYRTDKAVVFGIQHRTYHDDEERYVLDRVDPYRYTYRTQPSQRGIAAKQEFSSLDYELSLVDPLFVKRNNDHYLGSALEITLSKGLIDNNRIILIYFDGQQWKTMETF